MTRRPRRVVPAVLLALVLLAAAVAVIVSLVQRLTDTREFISYDRVAAELYAIEWGETPVLVTGIVAVAFGALLLLAAILPGRALLVPLVDEEGLRAGVSRRGLRAAVRESAETVDGVTAGGVRLGRRSVKVKVQTDRVESAGTADAVCDRVSNRLREIGTRSVRRVRTSLRTPEAANSPVGGTAATPGRGQRPRPNIGGGA
ncbi:DUF6286 domain-containing protein [Nocardia jiangsuensis]|uniref:DUF6286 domain-containing protein n=1 Tax=Nocardia jiangsuensis TaxID=1691563 RepID=A0ABV8DPV2_9NOCA